MKQLTQAEFQALMASKEAHDAYLNFYGVVASIDWAKIWEFIRTLLPIILPFLGPPKMAPAPG